MIFILIIIFLLPNFVTTSDARNSLLLTHANLEETISDDDDSENNETHGSHQLLECSCKKGYFYCSESQICVKSECIHGSKQWTQGPQGSKFCKSTNECLPQCSTQEHSVEPSDDDMDSNDVKVRIIILYVH